MLKAENWTFGLFSITFHSFLGQVHDADYKRRVKVDAATGTLLIGLQWSISLKLATSNYLANCSAFIVEIWLALDDRICGVCRLKLQKNNDKKN